MHVYLIFAMMAAQAPAPTETVGVESGAPMTVEQIVALVAAQNPRLHELEARTRAAELAPSQRAALPDPMVGMSLRRYAMEGEIRPGVMAEQAFPFPGKRPLRAEEAGIEAREARLRYDIERLALEEEARRLSHDILYLNRAEEILLENRAYLERLNANVLAARAAGRAPQFEAFRVQTSITEVEEKLVAVRKRREAAGALLNCCLALPPEDALWKRIISPERMSAFLPLEDIEALAEKRSPVIETARAGLALAETSLRLARRERLPDFLARGEYQREPGGRNEWTAFFGVSVPLYAKRKQGQAVREAEARLEAGDWAVGDAELNVLYDIRETFAMAERAREIHALYRDALAPQARVALDSAAVSYETGQVELNTYVQSFETYLKARLREAEEFHEHEKQAARLQMLAGVAVTQAEVSSHD